MICKKCNVTRLGIMERVKGQDPLTFHKLKGVRISPNPEAQLLEKHLGITFPQSEPIRVDLTLRNKLGLFIANPHLRDPLLFPYYLTSGHNSLQPGSYVLRYNAGLVRLSKDKDLRIVDGLTVNACGLIAQVNPEMIYICRALYPLTAEPNMWGIYGCVSEGVVMWTTAETFARTLEEVSEAAIDEWHRYQIYRGTKPRGTPIENSFIDEHYLGLLASIENYGKTLKEFGSRPQSMLAAVKFNLESRAIVGYYFVYRSVKALRRAGLSTADALETILHNPPRTISQLIR